MRREGPSDHTTMSANMAGLRDRGFGFRGELVFRQACKKAASGGK